MKAVLWDDELCCKLEIGKWKIMFQEKYLLLSHPLLWKGRKSLFKTIKQQQKHKRRNLKTPKNTNENNVNNNDSFIYFKKHLSPRTQHSRKDFLSATQDRLMRGSKINVQEDGFFSSSALSPSARW